MMKRRQLLGAATAISVAATLPGPMRAAAAAAGTPPLRARVRPGDPGWPSEARWRELGRAVGGRFAAVPSPWATCTRAPSGVACDAFTRSLTNPFFLGDQVGLTQTLGWVDAWTSAPSAYAVAAQTAGDVAAAVDFARRHRVRLVVKGGGHSYQGTSNAPDSLMVWTRKMNAITLHDGFVADGCAPDSARPAVTVEAGAMWGEVYQKVTTEGGRYVQGGGCLTVGVAGLIQSGGFGSLSKGFGLAAASLLQAEVVTADGLVRIANVRTNPELFWGLKGGGGGSLGVVTRVTLRTHELPASVGVVNLTVAADDDAAYRRLIDATMRFCAGNLVTPHWGEQIVLRGDNTLRFSLMFQGLSGAEATAIWQPLLDEIAAAKDWRLRGEPRIAALPARHLWDAEFLRKLPGVVVADDQPGAPPGRVAWAGDQAQAGQVLHGYDSLWLGASLLQGDRRALVDAMFAASRHWGFALHLNKGLAGAPAEAIAAARDTAIHPAALDAFALAISASEGPPAHPGLGTSAAVTTARRQAAAIGRAMAALRTLPAAAGSYVSEGNYFDADWQRSAWGSNYPRLQAVKARFDPEGLFFVHHGVGSERWRADGFTPIA